MSSIILWRGAEVLTPANGQGAGSLLLMCGAIVVIIIGAVIILITSPTR